MKLSKLSQYMIVFGVREIELARRAGVSQPVINRMRNGVGNWTTELMHKVASATDGYVTISDLAEAYVPPEKPKSRRRGPPKKRGRPRSTPIAPAKKAPAKRSRAKG